jgi:hypothetical protein
MKTAVLMLLAAAAGVLFLAPAAEAQGLAEAATVTFQVSMRTGPFVRLDMLCLSVGPIRDSSDFSQTPSLSLLLLLQFDNNLKEVGV